MNDYRRSKLIFQLKSSEETDFLGGIFEKFSLSSKDSEGTSLHYQPDFDETLTENYRGFESMLHSKRKDQSLIQPNRTDRNESWWGLKDEKLTVPMWPKILPSWQFDVPNEETLNCKFEKNIPSCYSNRDSQALGPGKDNFFDKNYNLRAN
ncbi:hypothetical protein ACTXT7_002125 [Hymenolepis weldensis]